MITPLLIVSRLNFDNGRGLEKMAVWSSRTSRFSCVESTFQSYLLNEQGLKQVQPRSSLSTSTILSRGREDPGDEVETSPLPTKLKKNVNEDFPGQAKFEICFVQRASQNSSFFQALNVLIKRILFGWECSQGNISDSAVFIFSQAQWNATTWSSVKLMLVCICLAVFSRGWAWVLCDHLCHYLLPPFMASYII